MSYLSEQDLEKPGIAANVKAIQEVFALIAFIGADEHGDCFGYWRGPRNRPVARCPIVRFDNEGQFGLVPGANFAQAILFAKAYEQEDFTELRDWLRSLGIEISWESPAEAPDPVEKDDPHDLHKKLYARHLRKGPAR